MEQKYRVMTGTKAMGLTDWPPGSLQWLPGTELWWDTKDSTCLMGSYSALEPRVQDRVKEQEWKRKSCPEIQACWLWGSWRQLWLLKRTYSFGGWTHGVTEHYGGEGVPDRCYNALILPCGSSAGWENHQSLKWQDTKNLRFHISLHITMPNCT